MKHPADPHPADPLPHGFCLLCLLRGPFPQAVGAGPAEVAKAPPAPPVLQEDLSLPGVASHPAPSAAPVLAILQVGRG